MASAKDDEKAKPSRISEELMAHTYRKLLDDYPDKFTRDRLGEAIVRFLKRDELSKNENFEISTKVMERLLLRHAILGNMESIESQYDASKTYVPRKRRIAIAAAKEPVAPARDPLTNMPPGTATGTGPKPDSSNKNGPGSSPYFFNEFEYDDTSERSNRTYRLAATDLFVEKAIAYLERDSVTYIRRGTLLFGSALFAIGLGCAASAAAFLYDILKSSSPKGLSVSIFDNPLLSIRTVSWMDFSSAFVKAFTFYGFIVLFAVFCVRLGKALMDQAERLRERRHSLRQGRLYIHLSNGEVTIEELEKAFDWNVSKGNAFGSIPTEASAPWGSVIKEALKAIPEIFKKARGAVKD